MKSMKQLRANVAHTSRTKIYASEKVTYGFLNGERRDELTEFGNV